MHVPFALAKSVLTRDLFHEDAQDLVEYSLTFAVLAFGCVAGMTSVAQAVDQTFVTLTNLLSTALQS